MDYELANELKEAGFPQHFKDEMYTTPNGVEYIMEPTLSELIEACGKNKEGNPIMCHLNWVYGLLKWECNGGISYGGTPEEAVARLWLALHMNDKTHSRKDRPTGQRNA